MSFLTTARTRSHTHLGKLLDARRDAEESATDTAKRQLFDAVKHSYSQYVSRWLKQTPTPQQLAIAEALEKPPYRVLVPSANNQGKTWFVASYARQFFDRHPASVTLITATTAVQVRDGVFKELRRVSLSCPHFMPRATRVERAPDHYIHGFTAATADGFQGRHDRFLGIAFDEATGIHQEFWDRAGTMFGGHEGHWWLCTYNPNDPSSPAYAAEESGQWAIVRLSALEHPNVAAELQGLAPPVPSAIRLTRILDRLAAECRPVPAPLLPAASPAFEFPRGTGLWWEPTSTAFEAQVLGRWPMLPTESLMSPAMVDAAIARYIPVSALWQLAVGVDVARFGSDHTAIVVRRGPCVLHAELISKRDTKWINHRLTEVVAVYATDELERRRAPIYVDDTGGYGGGVVDHLTGHNVVPVNMSAKPPVRSERYSRVRDYLWLNLAEIFAAGAIDLTRLDDTTHRRLRSELVAPRSRFDEFGRRKVEPKSQIKQRLGFSPDLADALGLTFFEVGT